MLVDDTSENALATGKFPRKRAARSVAIRDLATLRANSQMLATVAEERCGHQEL